METLKIYSATKFGKTRAEVEREIQDRWSEAERAKKGENKATESLVRVPKQEEVLTDDLELKSAQRPQKTPEKGFLEDYLAQKTKKHTSELRLDSQPRPEPQSILESDSLSEPAPEPLAPQPIQPPVTPEPAPQPKPTKQQDEVIFRVR